MWWSIWCHWPNPDSGSNQWALQFGLSAFHQAVIDIEIIFKSLWVDITPFNGGLQCAARFPLMLAVAKLALETPGLKIVKAIDDCIWIQMP